MAKVVLLIILVFWLLWRWHAVSADSFLHIVTCDVGQGDAILIRHKTVELLIDGGRDGSVLKCLQRFMPLGDRSLEVIVATHPDSDHINGLVQAMEFYRSDLIIINGQSKETTDFDRFKEAVEKQVLQGGKVIIAQQGQYIKMSDNIDISILYPTSSSIHDSGSHLAHAETMLSDVNLISGTAGTNYNNSSVVLKVSYLSLDMLLMGDLEVEGEQALLKQKLITDVDVLKVGHHGAKTSSSLDFIAASTPEIFLISVGKNNSYGHPNTQVVQRLEQSGGLILRTDMLSSIELVSDGHSIWQAKQVLFVDY